MKNAMVTNPTVIWNHWKNSAAKPHRLPSVLPTQAKMPPDSHPFTVAISAAHSATGKNHRMPPMIRKNTSWNPDDANDGYSYTVITMEAVMAKNPKNVNVRLNDGRLTEPTGPASAEDASGAQRVSLMLPQPLSSPRTRCRAAREHSGATSQSMRFLHPFYHSGWKEERRREGVHPPVAET